MSELINRQYYLAARPKAFPTPEEVPFRDVVVAEPGPEEVVIRNLYISLDPAIRGWMSDTPNYIEPIAINDPVRSSVIGRVVKSASDSFAEGDIVMTVGGWERYTTAPAAALNKIADMPGIALTNYLSVLGPTGLTAYFGILKVGLPKPGDTVLVSAAAGAVGSVVGQIAKMQGCRVVGMAGSEEKCRWLTEDLGFDEAINYKTCGDYQQAIQQACPEGVDIYFDNVGGEILDAALLCLNKFARVAVCGWISSYNDSDAPGPKNLWQLVAESVTIQGFVVLDYLDSFEEAIGQLAEWVMTDKIKFKEDIVDGLDNVLPAFMKLFNGTNDGKLVVRLEP
ncbi:Putative NADP-dependent oxidoreductase YfmJ [Sinobacterium norvegicum]|uniref:NADP-dependent oxidoreductase YfmJ n=1 Tax=Sinobacterium norvegicum TaxID=1641715 RepID=A0ABN8EP92_9GAMM|nr:NADP-dependent oxidoreductase [Sinobacterium norvegicum]CAH0993090.1 Putative NADP-dependent oxidoreductase YfmJ [Sinobacterium norvegicum]